MNTSEGKGKNLSIENARASVADLLQRTRISAVELLDALIARAYAVTASDLHVAPEREHITIRFRIDGMLEDAYHLPLSLHLELVARIKILAGLRTDEHSAAQDGRFRFASGHESWIDLRVSIVPTYYGENAVLRLLVLTVETASLGRLGFSEAHQSLLERSLALTNGMILTTGPTGSGKTTTLYALMSRIAKRDVAVVSIEDPVEYSISGVNQIQTNEHTGLTFAQGLRSILRQDPDIIMVGEIRDGETAGLATNAALTGHLVLSTLHTTDAPGALIRLRDLGIEQYLITSTVSLIIAQRLVRRICQQCLVTVTPDTTQRLLVKKLQAKVSDPIPLPGTLVRGAGCATCNGTGYHGRIGVYELLPIDDTVRESVMRFSSSYSNKVVVEGFIPMISDAVQKVCDGITTIDELIRIAHE